MIKFENTEIMGWEAAIRGMRNPMNSWEKSDSEQIGSIMKSEEISPGVVQTYYEPCIPYISIGKNDFDLMMKLANAGPVHGKVRRMITVYVDTTAPLYWWKEFDTYKVGTVANSCSTMHKIAEKEFTLEDFSCEHLFHTRPLEYIIEALNTQRTLSNNTSTTEEKLRKAYWWQMIQLLPSSYNQKRTVMLNYEVLANIYKYRKNHKLDEWVELCKWIESLSYSELITGRLIEEKD